MWHMKKRIKTVLICMIIVLTIGITSFAISADTCHHDFYERSGITNEVVVYTTSKYVKKNGRLDWWPVIVTEKYDVLHFCCRDCKKPIPELETWRLTDTSWTFAY